MSPLGPGVGRFEGVALAFVTVACGAPSPFSPASLPRAASSREPDRFNPCRRRAECVRCGSIQMGLERPSANSGHQEYNLRVKVARVEQVWAAIWKFSRTMSEAPPPLKGGGFLGGWKGGWRFSR